MLKSISSGVPQLPTERQPTLLGRSPRRSKGAAAPGGIAARSGGRGRHTSLRLPEPSVPCADSLRPAAPAPRGCPAPVCASPAPRPRGAARHARSLPGATCVCVIGAGPRRVGTCQGHHPGFERGELGPEEPANRPALCSPERLSQLLRPPPGVAWGPRTARLSRGTGRDRRGVRPVPGASESIAVQRKSWNIL